MKKKNKRVKYFTNNDQYFYFLKRDDIRIVNVIFTRNYKIKVIYDIIK